MKKQTHCSRFSWNECRYMKYIYLIFKKLFIKRFFEMLLESVSSILGLQLSPCSRHVSSIMQLKSLFLQSRTSFNDASSISNFYCFSGIHSLYVTVNIRQCLFITMWKWRINIDLSIFIWPLLLVFTFLCLLIMKKAVNHYDCCCQRECYNNSIWQNCNWVIVPNYFHIVSNFNCFQCQIRVIAP